MAPLTLVILLVHGLCLLHAYKHHEPSPWLLVIFLLPGIGCLLYVLIRVLPNYRQNTNKRQKTLNQNSGRSNPATATRNQQKALFKTNSPDEQLKLAEAMKKQGQLKDAVAVYKKIITDNSACQPKAYLGLAEIYYALGKFKNARQTLDALMANHSEFKSQDGHLLYALSCQSMGDTAAAEHEFKTLVRYFSGPAAKVRYAEFLLQQNRSNEARHRLDEVLDSAAAAPQFYRRQQREWLLIARRERAKLNER